MLDSWAVVRALAALLLLASAPAPGWCQAATPAPTPAWEGRFALGGSVRGGDQSRYAGNADLNLKRSWSRDSLAFRALADYGKTGGDRDSENYGAKLSWRRDVRERFFWHASTGIDADAVQGRNVRVTADTGPGYRLWEAAEKRFFDVQSGLGYRHEQFRRGEPENNLVDLRAGYEYQDLIGEVLELVHKTDVFAPMNDFENFLAKAEITLSVPLVGGLHFRNHARYEYVNEPAGGRESSNFWLTIGLEYRL